MLSAEKVKNEELILIPPKGERIKAFEELRKPERKHDCQVFLGMLSSLSKWNPTVAPEIPLITKATAAKGRFIWTDAMGQEYNTVRKTMLTEIKLTPFHEKKNLKLMIDGASTEGVGFVLFQEVNQMDPLEGAMIVNANCSRFKESQFQSNRGESFRFFNQLLFPTG